MATKMVKPEGSASEADVCLQLSTHEWRALVRALCKGLIRAREMSATADEADLTNLLRDLDIHTDDYA